MSGKSSIPTVMNYSRDSPTQLDNSPLPSPPPPPPSHTLRANHVSFPDEPLSPLSPPPPPPPAPPRPPAAVSVGGGAAGGGNQTPSPGSTPSGLTPTISSQPILLPNTTYALPPRGRLAINYTGTVRFPVGGPQQYYDSDGESQISISSDEEDGAGAGLREAEFSTMRATSANSGKRVQFSSGGLSPQHQAQLQLQQQQQQQQQSMNQQPRQGTTISYSSVPHHRHQRSSSANSIVLGTPSNSSLTRARGGSGSSIRNESSGEEEELQEQQQMRPPPAATVVPSTIPSAKSRPIPTHGRTPSLQSVAELAAGLIPVSALTSPPSATSIASASSSSSDVTASASEQYLSPSHQHHSSAMSTFQSHLSSLDPPPQGGVTGSPSSSPNPQPSPESAKSASGVLGTTKGGGGAKSTTSAASTTNNSLLPPSGAASDFKTPPRLLLRPSSKQSSGTTTPSPRHHSLESPLKPGNVAAAAAAGTTGATATNATGSTPPAEATNDTNQPPPKDINVMTPNQTPAFSAPLSYPNSALSPPFSASASPSPPSVISPASANALSPSPSPSGSVGGLLSPPNSVFSPSPSTGQVMSPSSSAISPGAISPATTSPPAAYHSTAAALSHAASSGVSTTGTRESRSRSLGANMHPSVHQLPRETRRSMEADEVEEVMQHHRRNSAILAETWNNNETQKKGSQPGSTTTSPPPEAANAGSVKNKVATYVHDHPAAAAAAGANTTPPTQLMTLAQMHPTITLPPPATAPAATTVSSTSAAASTAASSTSSHPPPHHTLSKKDSMTILVDSHATNISGNSIPMSSPTPGTGGILTRTPSPHLSIFPTMRTNYIYNGPTRPSSKSIDQARVAANATPPVYAGAGGNLFDSAQQQQQQQPSGTANSQGSSASTQSDATRSRAGSRRPSSAWNRTRILAAAAAERRSGSNSFNSVNSFNSMSLALRDANTTGGTMTHVPGSQLVTSGSSHHLHKQSLTSAAPRLAAHILHNIDQLLELSSSIPAEAVTQLEALRASMQNITQIILAKEDVIEIGNDIEVLTCILKNQATFDQDAVDAYRLASTTFQHEKYLYTAWNIPSYLSDSPIPSNIKQVTIAVHLPVEYFPVIQGHNNSQPRLADVVSLIQHTITHNHMQFNIIVTLHDTVDSLMRRAYAAYNALLPASSSFPINPSEEPVLGTLASRLICKVVGFNDYLLPHRKVFEHETIRHSIRNATQIEILLCDKPTDIHPNEQRLWQEILAWKMQYEGKIRRELLSKILKRTMYIDSNKSFQTRLYSHAAVTDVMGKADGSGMDYFPLHEIHTPFRVRILGLERVNIKTLPRLAHSMFGANSSASPASESVELFVRIYLVHGMSKLNYGPTSQTPILRYDTSSPRFGKAWIQPHPISMTANHITYSKLPRGTRILLLLYAIPSSSSSSSSSSNQSVPSTPGMDESEGSLLKVASSTLSPKLIRVSSDKSVESLTDPNHSSAHGHHHSTIHHSHHPSDKFDGRIKNEVLLGWSAGQLINEYGHLLHGKHEFNLWTTMCGLNEKTYNYGSITGNKEDLNQIMRNTNKHNAIGSATPGNVNSLNEILGTNGNGGGTHTTSSGTPAPGATSSSSASANLLSQQSSQSANVTPSFASLTLEFESFAKPVVSPLYRRSVPQSFGTTQKTLLLSIHPKMLEKNERKHFLQLLHSDPLYNLNNSDRELIWLTRTHLIYHPHMLPKFLNCIDWTNSSITEEAYKLLGLWSPPIECASILELLDSKYADLRIREYAVNVLDTRMSDSELQLYLLQLVQCLKFEAYHSSALSRFLLRRALANPYQIGHHLFWHLKAEMGNSNGGVGPTNLNGANNGSAASSSSSAHSSAPSHTNNLEFQERFTMILEEYLSYAGIHAYELRKQYNVVQKLQKIAELIVKLKVEEKVSDSDATKEYHKQLTKLNKEFFAKLDGGGNTAGTNTNGGGKFQIPLNPKLEAKGLIVSKCKFMSSKKVPLFLVFENADQYGPPIYIIFKSGDDLRQDILTLQLLKVMDKIWLDSNLDMRLKPYKCIATGTNAAGEGVGMIEVVTGSDTTSGIQLQYGGGALGALKLDPLDLFIRAHNTTPQQYEKAVDNFIRSCAGYCVATFILGIGDRHNGNIMVTQAGHLFHIDFGHFLGNFKKKFGFNRERSAFVFTPEMAYVMGGKNYKKSAQFKLFKELCFAGFNVLRKHAAILENLFLLMVSAGMPELQEREDVLYLRDMLCLDLSDREAEKRFKAEIKNSLDGTWRRLDNFFHNAKHARKEDQ